MTMIKRDTYKFSVTVKDSSGVVFNLTGYSMFFTAKSNPLLDDVDAEISSQAVITDPTSGKGEFTLTPDDTDVAISNEGYDYDVQISDGADNVYTVLKGKLSIVQDVRHSK